MSFLKVFFYKFKKSKEFEYEYLYPTFTNRRQKNSPLKVRILGDHSDLHCGCAAVIEVIEKECLKRGWLVAKPFQRYDVLIVNGEGSMHHNSKNFNKKMSVLRKATESNIPCYLLNSLWQDNSHVYDDVLSKLKICTREILSHEQLKVKHGVETAISIDASYFAEINLKDKFINLNNKPIKTDFYFPKRGNWGKDNNLLFPDVNNIEMSDFTWSGLVRSLETASLLITGRHHAVYAACKARIPFIVSDSNSHKITGLFETAGVKIPVAKSPEDLKDLLYKYKSLESEYLKLFNWLDKQNIKDVFPF